MIVGKMASPLKHMIEYYQKTAINAKKYNTVLSDNIIDVHINKLKEYDTIITNNWEFIKTYNTLVDLIGLLNNIAPDGGSSENIISRERLMKNRKLIQWLKENAGEYESCIGNNAEYVNSGVYEIVKGIKNVLNNLTINK